MTRPHRTWDLQTVTEQVPGGLVVILSGRISSVTADRLKEAVTAARAEAASVVVDLSGVDYISGAGVSVLQQAAGNGTQIIVCGLRDPVRISLQLSGVLSDLLVKETRQAAIDAIR